MWEPASGAGRARQAADAEAGGVHRAVVCAPVRDGAMRRTHLRGRDNIRKRILSHTSAFILSLVVRGLFEVGRPGGSRGGRALLSAISAPGSTG